MLKLSTFLFPFDLYAFAFITNNLKLCYSSRCIFYSQKKWDQPCSLGGPPGAQDPKKTCNLETYLDWSARLRLFVCNEILQVSVLKRMRRKTELLRTHEMI